MNPVAHAIIWLILLVISMFVVFRTVGMAMMVAFFPEGHRWWMFPVQLASLAFFAAVVLWHPF